jgi:hypothetical protein
MMSKIWQSRHLSTKTKVRIFNTTVISILLNGAETWKATKGIVQKLQAFVNKCLRKVLGIWWPNLMSNEEVWRRTNHEPINIITQACEDFAAMIIIGEMGYTKCRDSKNVNGFYV